MEYRFVMFETGSEPEIYKVPLSRTALLINKYPDRKVAVFQTLKAATAAALAYIEQVHASTRHRASSFSCGPSPEVEALRRRFSELTEDRVETFIP